jgi:protein-disulfide isomerase
MNPGVNKPTRNEQREAARAKAKEMREQHKKGERRKRLAIQAGIIGTIAIAVAAVVISLVSTSNNQALQATPTNMTFDGGIKIGQDLKAFTSTTTPTPDSGKTVPNIQVYLDYQCPVCQAFEVPNASQLESWVKTGAATVEYHPISFLDGRGSPNEYSSRAANAAICVAEHSPDNYFKFNNILFANQPEEGTAGPSNQDLISRAREAGVAVDDTFSSCVNDKVFANWISDTTDRVLSEPIKGTSYRVEGTPFILVNGKPYTWTKGEELVSPARFAQFVQAAN